jgi:CheY-like chemotaxis protein
LIGAAGGCDHRMCLMTMMCLIGEADPFLARLLERFGSASGLTVVWAKVGQELLNLAQALRPDIIVVDPELPGTLRGWEALRAIGADAGLAHIPVLTCSWLSEADALALAGDADGHLQKPELHYEDFVAALAGAGLNAAAQPVWQDNPLPV